MKKIILDASSIAYSFDGTKMEALGKTEKFLHVWNGLIYSIGNDLYLKKGDIYQLFASEAKLFCFGKRNPAAEKQFELLGDILLMINPLLDVNLPGLQKLPKEFADFFLPQQIPQEPAFVVKEKNGPYQVYFYDEESGIKVSEQSCINLSNDWHTCFWWNGGGYVLKEDGFTQISCNLIYQNEFYIVANVGNTGIVVNREYGLMRSFSCAVSLINTEQAPLLSVAKGYWHLAEEDVDHIATAHGEREDCYLNPDGTIVHNYVYEDREGPDVFVTDKFKFVDGAYKCILHEDN